MELTTATLKRRCQVRRLPESNAKRCPMMDGALSTENQRKLMQSEVIVVGCIRPGMTRLFYARRFARVALGRDGFMLHWAGGASKQFA